LFMQACFLLFILSISHPCVMSSTIRSEETGNWTTTRHMLQIDRVITLKNKLIVTSADANTLS
jgi:hypothetical protein